MRRRLAGLLLAVAAAVSVSACGASESSSGGAPAMRGDMAVAPEAANTGGGAGAGPAEPAKQAEQVAQPGVDRKLVRTASLRLITPDIADATSRARGVAIASGGYTGEEEVGPNAATMTLFVPSDKLDAALGELSGLGKVESRNQSAQDVTEQMVDVESRIQTQRASLERVRALLGQATGISEVVQLESEVTRREADLESLLKRREKLAGSVAMSTVTLRMSRDKDAPAPTDDDPTVAGAFSGGWHAFLDAAEFVVRMIAVSLPFLLVIGVPAYVVWRWRRRTRAARVVPQES
ncbi:putative lipoprotein [Alloactinosynnema sp. L-07]|uniref:DUF4349 domain-containing protein n=1 Tax=Alloactinosynnema sp. L-07 TaxID=1653480 RepID=UPI00065EF05E|nr:DUF4349 domain-containing protein [Alloactinosynnema sp. L-07]CRK60230.1 putative lipoprotein [Alloactinosynnema sp. L-07]